jgi:hypothetical protein
MTPGMGHMDFPISYTFLSFVSLRIYGLVSVAVITVGHLLILLFNHFSYIFVYEWRGMGLGGSCECKRQHHVDEV